MKDRLIQMLDGKSIDTQADVEYVADCLLENGVIVPPCKIGQTCYKVWNRMKVIEVIVVTIMHEALEDFYFTICFDCNGIICLRADGSRNERYCDEIYFTREEAEQALKVGVK